MEPGGGGGGQDFRLTWVNYSQKLTEAFNKFLSRETLCNVTLSVNRRSIKAHQAILSACSPWFEDVLMENQHPHPIIIIKDVKYEDIRNIIRFIYTGEVSIPQHELQDFLRTAELLEIKGLLKSPTATAAAAAAAGGGGHPHAQPPPPVDHHGHHAEHGIHLNAITPPPQTAVHQMSQPQLPTVPVSSILLGPAATAGSPAAAPPSSVAAGPITDGGIDLVSQIKQQQPVVLTAKRRNIAGNATVLVNDGHGLSVVTAANATHHLHEHEAAGVDGAGQAVPQLLHTAAEDETVTWMPEAADQVTEETVGHEEVPLTPAQAIANGVSDCGAFKRIWAERYLCYNLGREIICLLCFCRFTQFKKFNLERHMKNKHAQLYNLSESTRKLILERYVSRYEAHVTPSMVASVPSHGNEHMASEIMAVGPIQLDDLNLEAAEEVVGVAEAETAAAATLELVEEEAGEDKRGSPPPQSPPPTMASDVAAEVRLSAKSADEDDGKGNGGVGDDAGGQQTSANDDAGRSPRGLGQHKPSPPPPPSSDTPPAATIAAGGSREALPDQKRDKGQEGEVNERRGAGREGPPPGDNPVDQQLIVELEETEEDIVSTLQVKEEKEMF